MTDDDRDARDVRERLDEIGMFTSVGESYVELEDASDEELLRLAFDYARDSPNDESELSSNALAVFMLRERGYVVGGEPPELEVRDPDGNEIEPGDV